ncbi:MAG: sialate O-acetylesterase [Dyadobacter fermentans]
MKHRMILLWACLALFGTLHAQEPASGAPSLAPVFADHMVLQRGKPLQIYGRAAAGETVRVVFLGKTKETRATQEGTWKVEFTAQKAGGPYMLTISGKTGEVVLNDVMIGDVWLCSGQSNMDFPLKAAQTGPEELRKGSFNANIRLLKYGPTVPWGDVAWDSAALAKVNRFGFFQGEWKTADAGSVGAFSAVGYYFGQKIAAETNVPVGLIQVAVGGSPTESWIDRQLLAQDGRFTGLLSNWPHSEQVMPWPRERAERNTGSKHFETQQHPFKPGYNYAAGIAPLTSYPIAGVIWYQGESNVHDIPLHEALFETLVKSWRQHWGHALPFYYVQLSGIDRPNWPEFRDSQRQMLARIPHAGMAVSYDVGDSLDVHPVRKQEVGERLALLALQGYYHKRIVASGPIVQKATLRDGAIWLDFQSAQKLTTASNDALTGFELMTRGGKRLPAQAVIAGGRVRIAVPAGELVEKVLYAYQPFTRANLQNEAGLPASTFSIPVN